jgi:ligand-binding sensor domain-containing protein
MRKGTCFACLLLLSGALAGQSRFVRFDHLNLDDGLSQGSVYAILQDRMGFLWFGTQDGLNKYDGYDFTVYRHDKYDSGSISDNCIYSLFEDRDGYLWIGTLSGGLNRFDPRTRRFKSFRYAANDPRGLTSNLVTSIWQDRKGTVWVGTDNGLNRLERGGFVSYFKGGPSYAGKRVNCIYEDSKGTLWVGTTTGLYRYDTLTIWHGLMHKETRGKLTVDVTRDGEWLRCVVEDNGIGRQRAQELKSKSATRDKSMGMKITTDRLNLYQSKTKVEVIDLYDDHGVPAGTRVVIAFPCPVEMQPAPRGVALT